MSCKSLSIIIAIYNAEKVIRRCLDSIMYQKLSDVEIIVIDGGSSDSSVDIVKSFGNRIDYFLSERDHGVYDAWNKALKVSKGEWIMFLGADDQLIDGSISCYINSINKIKNSKKRIDIISAKCDYITKSGDKIFTYGDSYNYDIFKKHMNIAHGTTLHNHKLFEELGDFNIKYKICADYEFLLRKRLNSYYIDKVTIIMQTGGISNSMKALIEIFEIKREKKCVNIFENIFYFFRGFCSLQYRKLFSLN